MGRAHRAECSPGRWSCPAQHQGRVASSALSTVPLLIESQAAAVLWQLHPCWCTRNSRARKLSSVMLPYATFAGPNHHILHRLGSLGQTTSVYIILIIISLCTLLGRDLGQMLARWCDLGLWRTQEAHRM